jgi:hypothetical protein
MPIKGMAMNRVELDPVFNASDVASRKNGLNSDFE